MEMVKGIEGLVRNADDADLSPTPSTQRLTPSFPPGSDMPLSAALSSPVPAAPDASLPAFRRQLRQSDAILTSFR